MSQCHSPVERAANSLSRNKKPRQSSIKGLLDRVLRSAISTTTIYTMASDMSVRRLTKELKALHKDPIMNPRILVAPNETNILEINFVIEGTSGTPYEGGVYHGKLLFPKEYPLKPPVSGEAHDFCNTACSPLTTRSPLAPQNIMILTPNGRFAPNRSLCVSII